MMPFKLILRVILWVVWLSAAYCFGQSKPTKNEVINSCAEVGENNTRGYLGSDIYPLATQNWSAQQLAKFRISIDGDDLGLSAWILSMSKYQKIRKAALLIQQYSMSEILKKFNPEAQSDNYQSLNFWIQEFKNFASQSTYLPVTQNFVREKLFQINQNIDFHKQLKLLKFAAPILCPKISCIRGLKDIINFTSPKNFIIDDSSTVISFTKIWQEVLTDARYQVALAKLSLTMSHKIQQLESNHLTPFENHNIYDDTIKAFSELGLTSKEVQNMTYNILGLYGSRGASVDFLRHFINQENYPTAIMLQFIFTAISYLDSFKSLNLQTLYSLPQEIKTSCDFGKPYHFWMSAYLSFKLKRKTLKKSSLYGAHLMGNLYEAVNTKTFGRNNIFIPFIEDLYSLKNNSIRIGSTYRYLGALWAYNQKVQDLDVALYQYTLRSKKLSDKKMKKLLSNPTNYRIYQSWKEMFDSDFFLKHYK